MTKTLVFAVSIALAAAAVGCSADATDDPTSTTTTVTNGTLPADPAVTVIPDEPVQHHLIRDFAAIAEKGEGIRETQIALHPEIDQKVPELQLKPEPINQ